MKTTIGSLIPVLFVLAVFTGPFLVIELVTIPQGALTSSNQHLADVVYLKAEENPIIKYSTYLGGSDGDPGTINLLDSSNNPIIIGMTKSSDFPVTIGTAPTSGIYDIFITKFNADNLSEILFSSILSGNDRDEAWYGFLDDDDNIYFAGCTSSTDFATPNAYDESYNGGEYDGFVSKISANGTELFTTYIGGQDYDYLWDICVDSAKNIWVAGGTRSDDYPITADAYDSNNEYGIHPDPGLKHRDGGEGVYSKLSANGSILLYSSYFGGSDNEANWFLKIDNSDNVILSGWVRSENFPTTNEAWDKTYAGGQDLFITKFAANGSTMLFSTLIGGSGDEEPYNFILDSEGNFIISGWTTSADFPTSPDAFDSAISGTADIFLTKISKNGSTLIFSTYLGGSEGIHWESTMGLAFDDISLNIYVVGRTHSFDFPTTDGSKRNPGYPDACAVFISIFPSNGSLLLFSTVISGTNYDYATSISLLSSKEAYIVITTSSDDFPVTQNVYDDSYNGHSDLYFGDAGLMKVEFPSEYTPMTEPPEQSTTTSEITDTTTTSATPSSELVFILPVVVLAFSISRIFRKKRGKKFF